MGFFRGVGEGFGCAGHGCGFLVGVVLFLILIGTLLKVCTGG